MNKSTIKNTKKNSYLRLPKALLGNFADPKLKSFERTLILLCLRNGVEGRGILRGWPRENLLLEEKKRYIVSLASKKLSTGEPVFQHLAISKGRMEYQFCHTIVEATKKRAFIRIDLEEYSLLRSQYAKIFYELLCEFERTGLRYLSMRRLRALLGAEAKTYRCNSRLFSKIVSPALASIEKQTTFKVSRFFINDNDALQIHYARALEAKKQVAKTVEGVVAGSLEARVFERLTTTWSQSVDISQRIVQEGHAKLIFPLLADVKEKHERGLLRVAPVNYLYGALCRILSGFAPPKNPVGLGRVGVGAFWATTSNEESLPPFVPAVPALNRNPYLRAPKPLDSPFKSF